MTEPASTPVRFVTLASLADKVGQALTTSAWVTIDQQRINLFAQATGDHQWIHTDPVRAAQGPFGTTIAHGFLTLSLLPELAEKAMVIDDVTMGINYGLNKVRFPAPVPAGSRVRARLTIAAIDDIAGGAQILWAVVVEREGGDKPVCVAEFLMRRD